MLLFGGLFRSREHQFENQCRVFGVLVFKKNLFGGWSKLVKVINKFNSLETVTKAIQNGEDEQN